MQNHKKVVSILLAVFVVAVATTLAELRPQDPNGSSSITKKGATPVQEGGMTTKQRAHSKLYKEYKTGKKLRDLAAEIGDVKLRRHAGPQGGDLNEQSLSLDKFLQSEACGADAVVVVVVKSKSSQLTEDEDYIFTDYETTIEEVLKDNTSAPIQTKSNITITRPGGTIQFDGRTIEAIDDSFEPLMVGGRYILFLQFLPTTGSYKSLNSTSGFRLKNKRIDKLTRAHLQADGELVNEDETSFIARIRVAAAVGCDGLKRVDMK
jgi:hypothetical protein